MNAKVNHLFVERSFYQFSPEYFRNDILIGKSNNKFFEGW